MLYIENSAFEKADSAFYRAEFLLKIGFCSG
jgi:hypothetical protein